MFKKCQDHLDSVHESYTEHLCVAVPIGLRMIGGGVAAILHGLCPAVFVRTGSKTIFSLYDELKSRTAKSVDPSHD
ncbi:MAG: hypothetical protein DI551_12505 [Micavibrio aeruginosavorus]|uniref:Capsule biosynthesis protein n=1 Tax=Micavibrio aeruginosavorus TaxID=349221 RepID=A0A2W5MR49_9BACT|nr:MAG: hypothetical protein DI551_12505 [Micavibrio aeruginosavorus]